MAEYIYVEAGYVEEGPPLIQAKVRIDRPPTEEEITELASHIRRAMATHRQNAESASRIAAAREQRSA
jgi:hypothetical protein